MTNDIWRQSRGGCWCWRLYSATATSPICAYQRALRHTRSLTHTTVTYCWHIDHYEMTDYSASDREAEYCDERVCLCVCVGVFVCPRSYLRNYTSNFFCLLLMAVAQSSSGDVMICYILPDLWMTSYLLISQGCSTSPPSWNAVHTRPWAWL